MQLSSKNVGIFEAFHNLAKPISLMNEFVEVSKGGKFPSGLTEIPFEVLLKPKNNRSLFETYHGVFITIQASQYSSRISRFQFESFCYSTFSVVRSKDQCWSKIFKKL
ncbi:hypothetical protein SSS_02150 [Sarcoptes scabiei]|nr:hypothetical protein SSS_02150 [Sarcoptes scabiei]